MRAALIRWRNASGLPTWIRRATIGREQSIEMHDGGTVVVVQGPRFATRAESRWYGKQGWHVINMTQYPEVVIARELGMCYVNVALITDYDAGTEADPEITQAY
jgi:5'-methylthioadenosine phosphorylase